MDVSAGCHPEWGNQITKEVTWYALSDKWILAQKPWIPKIQPRKHKKIKKDDQLMDTSFLPRIGNKISMEGVAETKFGANTKGWTIQRLPNPGIHPTISHQTQTLLDMPARFCWKDPDIASCCLWGKASVWQIQKWMFTVIIGWNTGPPMEELEKVPKELKGSTTL